MGTNYYFHRDVCPHCSRPEEIIHIGKSSFGWQFSFHATDDIRSWREWQELLNEDNSAIYDEYGKRVTADEFAELIKAKQASENLNHALEVHKDPAPHLKSYLRGQFVDDEGYSFSEGDFS